MEAMTKAQKRELGIKEIASRVREQLKKEFPGCKFSVTIERYSMGQSLTVALMAAPFEAFQNSESKQYGQLNQYQLLKDRPENQECNGNALTAEAWDTMKRAVQICNEYNYDNSDPVTDYFEVNFYMHIEIGRYDRPFSKLAGESKKAE